MRCYPRAAAEVEVEVVEEEHGATGKRKASEAEEEGVEHGATGKKDTSWNAPNPQEIREIK